MVRVDFGRGREVIHGGAEVFRIDVGRRHIPRLAAAFTRIGRIKGNRQEAALRHGLRVEARGLLLHGAERTAHGYCRELAFGILRLIEIRGERDAVAVFEGDFAVLDLVALSEGLVPGRCELETSVACSSTSVNSCGSRDRARRGDSNRKTGSQYFLHDDSSQNREQLRASARWNRGLFRIEKAV